MAVDVSDPAIKRAHEDVRSDRVATNWMLVGYSGSTNRGMHVMKLEATGEGGYREMVRHLTNDKILYGYVRVRSGDDLSNRTKFLFVTWVGEKASILQRARASTHKQGVGNVLTGYSIAVHATTLEELAEDLIIEKITQSGGANYDGGRVKRSNSFFLSTQGTSTSAGSSASSTSASGSLQISAPSRLSTSATSHSPASPKPAEPIPHSPPAPAVHTPAMSSTAPASAPPQSPAPSSSATAPKEPHDEPSPEPPEPYTTDLLTSGLDSTMSTHDDTSYTSSEYGSASFSTLDAGASVDLRIAFGAASVQGRRTSMEDRHVAIASLSELPGYAYFAVYDGHAGDEAAHYCAQYLHGRVATNVAKATSGAYDSSIAKAIQAAYLALDMEFLDECENHYWSSGTTAVSVLVDRTRHLLVTVNLGDSRAVLAARGGVAIALSRDHKPHDPEERRRIEAAGATVENGRVNNTHAVSRSIGDGELKKNLMVEPEDQAISPRPDVFERPLERGDEFVILACDGLWDVLDNQAAVDFVKTEKEKAVAARSPVDWNAIASQLVDRALELGSTDNITVIIVSLMQ